MRAEGGDRAKKKEDGTFNQNIGKEG